MHTRSHAACSGRCFRCAQQQHRLQDEHEDEGLGGHAFSAEDSSHDRRDWKPAINLQTCTLLFALLHDERQLRRGTFSSLFIPCIPPLMSGTPKERKEQQKRNERVSERESCLLYVMLLNHSHRHQKSLSSPYRAGRWGSCCRPSWDRGSS